MKKLIITDASAARPVLSMHTLRFSRTVKVVLGGRGMTVDAMLEVRVSTSYDAGAAVLDVIDKGNGQPAITLHPMPEPCMALGQQLNQVEMAMPASDTIVVDLAGMVIRQIEAAEERAIEILAPTVTPPQSGRARLLAGSHMKHGLPDPMIPAEKATLPEAQ